MGTSIELTVGGVSLTYSKNDMGIDHGSLFQEPDRTRVKSDAISYEWYEENPGQEDELAEHEAAFVRPLHRVIPRLDLLGFTIETAKAEYDRLVSEEIELRSEYHSLPVQGFMSFDEFCAFCGQFPLQSLDDTYIENEDPDRGTVSKGRFAALADEIQRIPGSAGGIYWSEKSYFASCVCILSHQSMLQVFGQHAHNADAPVAWEYGPLVHAGWAHVDNFYPGSRRRQTILIATEGTSDARILRRALDILRPDVADFFRFIDVNERHHFWGTGALTKFAEGLVRIDVQNNVLFVLDNDAEGVEAFRRLESLRMPTNMRAMLLPELEVFRNFPTRGPDGIACADINRRAAGIECYLDLRLPERPPAKVIWTNYKPVLDTWHGALEYKEAFADYFYRQDDSALLTGAYDTTNLQLVLDAVHSEATELLSEAPTWLHDEG